MTDFLEGSGIETERGVLVDEHMRTNVANIWAAGDVAQARGFFTNERIINGILPDAVDQGRIAGMAMAEDPGSHVARVVVQDPRSVAVSAIDIFERLRADEPASRPLLL